MAGMSIADAVDLARDHLRAGRAMETEALCRLVLETDAGHAWARHLLGLALLARGLRDEGLAELIQATRSAGSDVAIPTNLGTALRGLDRPAEAVVAYRAAIAVDPAYAPAHYGLGLALAATGDRTGGVAAKASALVMVPSSEEAITGIDDYQLDARYAIHAYLHARTEANQPTQAVLGGYWGLRHGWLILDPSAQPLTAPLNFPDASLDAIFVDDGFTGLSPAEAEGFFGEALRVLKPGGVLRVVTTMLERLLEITASPSDEVARTNLTLIGERIPEVAEALNRRGVDGAAHLRALLINAAVFGQGRRFLWSAALMTDMLRRLGFADATIHAPGEGPVAGRCIERSPRVIPQLYNPDPAFIARLEGDLETLAVEAVKADG